MAAVVHGAAEGEVRLDVPLQVAEWLPHAAEPAFEEFVFVDFVEYREPVARRGFGVRPVGPELGEHARVVATGDHLRRIGFAGDGIDVVAGTRVSALEGVEEVRVVLEVARVLFDVAETCGRDVDRHTVVRAQVRRPDGAQGESPLVAVGERAVDGRRHPGVVVHPVGEAAAVVADQVGLG